MGRQDSKHGKRCHWDVSYAVTRTLSMPRPTHCDRRCRPVTENLNALSLRSGSRPVARALLASPALSGSSFALVPGRVTRRLPAVCRSHPPDGLSACDPLYLHREAWSAALPLRACIRLLVREPVGARSMPGCPSLRLLRWVNSVPYAGMCQPINGKSYKKNPSEGTIGQQKSRLGGRLGGGENG